MYRIEYENTALSKRLIIYSDASDNKDGGYESRMIRDNRIETLLSYKINRDNDVEKYIYDTESMLSLKELSDKGEIKNSLLQVIIEGIILVIKDVEKYLLSNERIIISKDTIFINSNNRARFCYFPYAEEDTKAAIKSLFEYILENLDHTDKQAVDSAYEIYKQIDRGNYDFTSFVNRQDSNPQQLAKVNLDENRWEKRLLEEKRNYQNNEITENEKVDYYRNNVIKTRKKDKSGGIIIAGIIIIVIMIIVIIYVVLYSLQL